MFSANRSYSSNTSCSRGDSSGGERSGLDDTWSIVGGTDFALRTTGSMVLFNTLEKGNGAEGLVFQRELVASTHEVT
jgi:hypothetical protein